MTKRLSLDLPGIDTNRDNALTLLNAAYERIAGGRQDNFGMWQKLRYEIAGDLQQRYTALGYTAAPFDWHAFWRRIDLSMPAVDGEAHLDLVRALMTDAGPLLEEHIQYRQATDGNVHLEFKGPTGMAKSSCAVGVADWAKPIAADELESHLCFDISELPAKLMTKQAGDTVIQDEYVAAAGEGSLTMQHLFSNLEDTLRGSQVNLFACSPREQKHATMQASLEVIMWNRAEKRSLFLLWLKGRPHGVVALPWMRSDLWQPYWTWKEENLRRTKAGQFKDTRYLAKVAMRCFENQGLVDYLCKGAVKPRKQDFAAALEFFAPAMLTTAQQGKVAEFMFDVTGNWARLKDEFAEWFGVEANPGLLKVAQKCATAGL